MPPLNEVAFAAYARVHRTSPAASAGKSHGAAGAFLAAVRLVMGIALPFYAGLAVAADPLVYLLLGQKWIAAAPLVRLLSLAMPFMTMQVLLAPACDAAGRPGIGVRNGAAGAAILVAAFAIGARSGAAGLAAAWVVAYPVYLAISLRRSLPVIGVRIPDLWRAVRPPLVAAIAMAGAVAALDATLAPMPAFARLALLVAAGTGVYCGWLTLFDRRAVAESWALIRPARPAPLRGVAKPL